MIERSMYFLKLIFNGTGINQIFFFFLMYEIEIYASTHILGEDTNKKIYIYLSVCELINKYYFNVIEIFFEKYVWNTFLKI